MDKIDKIIREAEKQSKRVWLSDEIIKTELKKIRQGFDRQNNLSVDQLTKLKVLESIFINRHPGWQ